MKNQVLVLILFFSLPSFASIECPGAPVVARSGGHESSGGRPFPPSAIEVHFASDGTGADSKGYEILLTYAMDGLRTGSVLKILNKKWGREGESSLCLQFDSVTRETQAFNELFKSVCSARDLLKTSPEFERHASCDDADFGL